MMDFIRQKYLPLVLLGVVGIAPSAFAQDGRLAPVIDRSGGGYSTSAVAVPKATASSLETRVARLERLMENQALVDMLMRLDSLQTESQSNRGELEGLVHEFQNLKQRQRDLYLDIDRRLRAAELASVAVNSAPAVPAAINIAPLASVPAVGMDGGFSVVAEPTAPADPVAERAAYQKAFDELKQGRYEEAITAFQAFSVQFPRGEYASNAQYWLGEANYVTRRYRVAEKEFKKVIDAYPDSSKVADAMLKLGYTYYELSEWAAAREILSEVVARNSRGTVARLAQNRLQKMKLEGR